MFGPYYIPIPTTTSSNLARISSPTKDLAAKFIVGGLENHRSRQSKRSRRISESLSSATMEVWFHEDCVCWMQDISLVGTRLFGLEEAIQGAQSALCSTCKKPGSTMACLKAGCREMAHFPCARESKWQIDCHNFEAHCSKHKSQENDH